ncbi:50S ribosomal protein L3 [Candidatus Bathyarchaeota archaeon]|nr:MAG: 50S ribosomal protein L3 [Candidatus Bathyarchaeota archaeon]TMI32025.1 MAG: 50S ribosomal protein L3 [Candidatus Bathyarchaeota archaeon]
MGHRKYSAPRRGSLAYLPRGRATHWSPRIRFWPRYEGPPKLLAFAGFKAGTTHSTIVDNRQGSLTYGKEVTFPVTVVETPPLVVSGLRFYEMWNGALRSVGEVWASDTQRDLGRAIKLPEKFNSDAAWEKLEPLKERVREVRAIVSSQPRLAKTGKKEPDILEVKIDGGSVTERWEFGKKLLGTEVKVTDVFKEGGEVDVVAITKGKGIQGPVKRWGIKKLKHKSRKTVRGVGSIGPWHPHFVMYSVPRPGQMGFAQRTEYNKQILRLSDNPADINPQGGFLHYGPIKTQYALLRGTVPGPAKRLVALRYPSRGIVEAEPPKLEQVSLASKQGA